MSQRPQGAPMCYGRQYEDHDQECQGCSYRQACKPEFLRGNGMLAPPFVQPAPFAQPTPPSPWAYHRTPSAPAPAPVPVPIQPYAGMQQVPRISLPVIQPTQQQAPAVPTQPVVSPLPVIQAFNPYFQQYYQPYGGESTIGRVGTHIGLRMGYTLFSELAKFCEVWRPEPPFGI